MDQVPLPDHQARQVALRLKQSKEEILERWEIVVKREFEEARQSPRPTLRDALPQFLDTLVSALQEQKIAGHLRNSLIRVAREHGDERAFCTDYTIEHVVREYELLRKVIFDVLEREQVLERRARETILDAVSEGMTKAIEQFAQRVAEQEEAMHEQIEESEDLFKTIFDLAAAGKALVDVKTGRFLRANKKLCEMLGYSEDELKQKTFMDVTDPEDRHWQTPYFHEQLAKKSSGWSVEKRYLRKDGTVLWVFVSGAPVHSKTGQVTQVISTMFDISKRKAAEEALRRSEEYNRLILESSEDCFNIISLDGRLLELTEKGRKHLEIDDVASVINKNWLKFWSRPEDEAAAAKAVSDAITLGRGHFVGHYRTPSGQREWWDVVISPMAGARGEPERLLVVSRDITAARKAEEALRDSEQLFHTLADSIPQLAWMADPSGSVFWYNRRWHEYTGSTIEEMKGWKWQAVHHPDFVDKVTDKFKKQVEAGEPWEDLFPLRRYDGEWRWFLSRALPMKDSQGKVLRWFGTNTDVTQEKHITDLLQEERKLREQFINTITHDLRTPLSAIRISSQILQRRVLQVEGAKELTDRIVSNVIRCDRMIQDLLDSSRVQAGQGIAVNIQESNLQQVVEETINNLESIHGGRFLFESRGDFHGHWCPIGLSRIIENLCSNAIKYGQNDTPVSVVLDDLGDWVRLSVHNHGNPLAKQDIDTLFDPFRRARAAETSGIKGWGIGLTIVRGVVEAHCGNIQVESTRKAGTIFTVTLPRDSRPCQEIRQRGHESRWNHPVH